MMALNRKLGAASVMTATQLLTGILSAQSPTVDLLLLHDHILTVDEKDSVAQAMAIHHGIIVKVGIDARFWNSPAMFPQCTSSTCMVIPPHLVLSIRTGDQLIATVVTGTARPLGGDFT